MTRSDTTQDIALDRALRILADCHTDEDVEIGFRVHQMGCRPIEKGYGDNEYVEAWGVVRRHLHMPTEPKLEHRKENDHG